MFSWGVGVLADLSDDALHSDGAPVLMSRILRHRPDGPRPRLHWSRPARPRPRRLPRLLGERGKGSEPGFQNTLALLAAAWSRDGDDQRVIRSSSLRRHFTGISRRIFTPPPELADRSAVAQQSGLDESYAYSAGLLA